jgi:two-component system chemotaxis response regulator CheY
MNNPVPHKHRVLIVDDDENIRFILIESLTRRGYHCAEAEHGEAAIRCLDTDRFHLVISDYQMPIMDGIQFLEALKKHPTRSPPVILMTGTMGEEFRNRAVELGAYAVIVKPFDSQELATFSARAIERWEIDQSGHSEMGSD